MIWFGEALNSVAILWRLERRDGVAIGLTGHDRDLLRAGLTYRAAPGMVPSAIELTDGLEPGSMDVEGALTSDAIRAADLDAGLWDNARAEIAITDWSMPDGEVQLLASGELGAIERRGEAFTAAMEGLKRHLAQPVAPRTSPACRARFCGPGCGLGSARFTLEAVVVSADGENTQFAGIDAARAEDFRYGALRWLSGLNTGLGANVIDVSNASLVLSGAFRETLQPGDRARLIEGCDRSLATCAGRFGNAINFRGEPHLPGNDLLTRFPGS